MSLRLHARNIMRRVRRRRERKNLLIMILFFLACASGDKTVREWSTYKYGSCHKW